MRENIAMNRSFAHNVRWLLPLFALTLFVGYLSSAPEAQAQNAPAGAVSAPVDLVLNDTSLGAALQIMAEQAGKKVDAHVPLTEKVNLDLRGMGFEEAVARVMAGMPYMYAIDNDTVHVFKGTAQPVQMTDAVPVMQAPVQPMVAEPKAVEKPKASRIFLLKNRKAEELVVILKQVSNEVGLVPDVRTNTILIKGNEEDVERVASLAADLDGMEPVRELEDKREYLSEVFSLEYVNDFTDLENNLNMIMYGQRGSGQGGNQTTTTQTGGGLNQQYQEQMGENKPLPIKKEYYLLDKIRRVLMITASRDKMEIIREYFKRVNTPIAQVQIEAHIVAMDAGFERSLGINWSFQGGYSGPTRPTANPLGIPPSTTGNETNTDPTQGFEFGTWSLANLSFVLQSAESQNKGRILSQPRVMTLSGNQASIQIGTKYPYKQSTTQNNTGTTENVSYVDVGIILNVTPQVNKEAGSIVMKLHPEVSDVLGFRNDAPIITTRQTDTVVEVNDGETVVIGGLLRDENLRSRNDVPILRDIPILGEFFRFSKKSKGRTNLIIMITPKIMDPKGQWVNKPKPVEKINPNKKIDRSARYQKMLENVRQILKTDEKKDTFEAPAAK